VTTVIAGETLEIREKAAQLLDGARRYLSLPGRWTTGTVGPRDGVRCMIGAVFQADDEEACLSSPEGKLAFRAPRRRGHRWAHVDLGEVVGEGCHAPDAHDRARLAR